ncbi:MAG: carboxypeptidase-like regulatory domain-containing protein [bacterium]
MRFKLTIFISIALLAMGLIGCQKYLGPSGPRGTIVLHIDTARRVPEGIKTAGIDLTKIKSVEATVTGPGIENAFIAAAEVGEDGTATIEMQVPVGTNRIIKVTGKGEAKGQEFQGVPLGKGEALDIVTIFGVAPLIDEGTPSTINVNWGTNPVGRVLQDLLEEGESNLVAGINAAEIFKVTDEATGANSETHLDWNADTHPALVDTGALGTAIKAVDKEPGDITAEDIKGALGNTPLIGSTGTVKGKVTFGIDVAGFQAGAGVPRATVNITDPFSTPVQTDEAVETVGNYTIEGVAPGKFTITVDPSQIPGIDLDVIGKFSGEVEVKPGETTTFDIKLEESQAVKQVCGFLGFGGTPAVLIGGVLALGLRVSRRRRK